MIDEKGSDEKNQIDENDEDISTDYIEVLKVGTLCPKRDIYDIEKESNERNQVNIIDDKNSYEKDQIGKNEE